MRALDKPLVILEQGPRPYADVARDLMSPGASGDQGHGLVTLKAALGVVATLAEATRSS